MPKLFLCLPYEKKKRSFVEAYPKEKKGNPKNNLEKEKEKQKKETLYMKRNTYCNSNPSVADSYLCIILHVKCPSPPPLEIY